MNVRFNLDKEQIRIMGPKEKVTYSTTEIQNMIN